MDRRQGRQDWRKLVEYCKKERKTTSLVMKLKQYMKLSACIIHSTVYGFSWSCVHYNLLKKTANSRKILKYISFSSENGETLKIYVY